MMQQAKDLAQRINDIQFRFDGKEAPASWEELPPGPMPLNRRLSIVVRTHMQSTSGVTQTQKDNYAILMDEFPPLLEDLKKINIELKSLEDNLEELNAPWTPGRIPK